MQTKKCPRCGAINDDNWPLDIGGVITEGGCQDCWEEESDREWWKEVEKLEGYYGTGQGGDDE